MKQLILFSFLSLVFVYCKSDNSTGELATPVPESKTIIGDEFEISENALSYVILTTSQTKLLSNKELLNKFNNEYGYNGKRSNSIYLGTGENKIPLIVMRRFVNMEDAEAYVKTIKEKHVGEEIQEVFPIGQSNYRRLLKNKNLEGYLSFYKKYIAP